MQTMLDFRHEDPPRPPGPLQRSRPNRSERLFLGSRPDPDTSSWMARIGRLIIEHHHPNAQPRKTDHMHISAHHVGDYKRLPGKIIYAAQRVGAAVVMPPFEVTCRCVLSFEGGPPIAGRRRKYPLVLLCEGEGLFEFYRKLGIEMRRFGFRVMDEFLPHITLAYSSVAIPMQAIETIRFVLNDFELIHSELGLTQYNTLGRWPLQAA